MQRQNVNFNTPHIRRIVPLVATLALMGTACGSTTTSIGATSDGSAGSAGSFNGAVAVDAGPADSDSPTTSQPSTPTPADVTTNTTPVDAPEPTAPPTADAPVTTEPPVTPTPPTIPPIFVPEAPDPGPIAPPTVPPVFVPPAPDPGPAAPPTVPPVFVPTAPIPLDVIPTVFEAAPTRLNPCGAVGPIAGDASITSELTTDLNGDGVDDHAVAYFDGAWAVRTTVAGLMSEVAVTGVGAHAVNLLGTADIGEVRPGAELLATVGGGASQVEVGVFGIDSDGCVFSYENDDGEQFVAGIGATTQWGNGAACNIGEIVVYGFQQQPDSTWTTWSAAYHETTVGVFSFVPASDELSEGVSMADLEPAEFDCLGVTV